MAVCIRQAGFLLLCVTYFLSCEGRNYIRKSSKRFELSFAENVFLLDGKPFQYVSGSMHYFRVPRELWADRLHKMRYAGLNTLQTYIYWKGHEPQDGTYEFGGNLDIETFIEEAKKQDLLVIVRLGPYIDAEVEMGGLPFWLLSNNPGVKLRTSDKAYFDYVVRWFRVLLPKLRKHLISNGGNVIMAQVENEYGSYAACDFSYTSSLRDIVRSHLGDDVVLFTTDGNGDGYLKCGKIPDVYATVDFGPGSDVSEAFAPLRRFEPHGPLVNSEYYTGWLDLWGEPHSTRDPGAVSRTLDKMLTVNASVNFYMFHGGTSFGFMSGGIDSPYRPCPTSYDYDAPLSEAGDMTHKYYLIKETLEKHFAPGNVSAPSNSTKAAYGQVNLFSIMNLWESALGNKERRSRLGPEEVTARWPMSFEELRQDGGFVLYETTIKRNFRDPAVLKVDEIGDRGYVFVNRVFVGLLSHSESVYQVAVSVRKDDQLYIFVENQGRVSYGPNLNKRKGITSNVTLDKSVLEDWTMYPMPLNSSRKIMELMKSVDWRTQAARDQDTGFFMGSFTVHEGEEPADTFLDMSGWRKGVAFINGHNLGRYWPIQGPQMTLYVPSVFLLSPPLRNRVMIFEQELAPCRTKKTCAVNFLDKPILNGPVPN